MDNNVPDDDSKLDDLRNIEVPESNDVTGNQMLSYEHLIDPGNEHHHLFDEEKIEDDVIRAPKLEGRGKDVSVEEGKKGDTDKG
jgi:hypothetical protein